MNYTTSILVNQSQAEIYEAVNNVRGWWQGEIKGNTDNLNEVFSYQMTDVHFSKQKIVELIPNKRVAWLVTESNISFVENKDEWIDTQISFDISTVGKQTQLTFTHKGLTPELECYDNCSNAWGNLIQKSLYSLITNGEGVKVFN
jgi:hypothetical protein